MRYLIPLLVLGCASEPEYQCTSVGSADCPMSICCPEGQYDDVGDCYIETEKREYQCPGNGDATCNEGLCMAFQECGYDSTTLAVAGC